MARRFQCSSKRCRATAQFLLSVPTKPERGSRYACRIHLAAQTDELNRSDEICRVEVVQC